MVVLVLEFPDIYYRRIMLAYPTHIHCADLLQLINTAVRAVVPFDPDASDLPVAGCLASSFRYHI